MVRTLTTSCYMFQRDVSMCHLFQNSFFNKTVSNDHKSKLCFVVPKNVNLTIFVNSKKIMAAQIQNCRQVHMSRGRNLYYSSNPKIDNSGNCVWPQLKQKMSLFAKYFSHLIPSCLSNMFFCLSFWQFQVHKKP